MLYILGSGIPASGVFYDLYIQNGLKWYIQVDALAVTDIFLSGYK